MLRKSKSIDEIYEEVKQYDLVITNDAPLATALNRLIEKPRLDYFALTPRQIASKYAMLSFKKLYSKAEIILEIVRQTKKPLKLIHQSIEKIFDVWNHTGLLESCGLYLGEEIKLLEYLEKFPSIETAMENFNEEFYKDKKIAVIGLSLFNELDKQVLPKKSINPDEIGLFSDEDNSIEKTYLFGSANDLLNQTIDLITPENENEIAIILNTDSKYLDVLKSRLNSKGINLQIKSFLSENIQTGNLLSLMELSLSLHDLKLKDVLFLETVFDISLNRKHSEYYFSNYIYLNKKNIPLQRIYEIMSEVITYSFGKLFEVLQKSFQISPPEELLKVIDILELTDRKVNEENLNLLNYFITNIDVELDRSDKGVLFVNALNSAFIDRQVVLFIGMDESWCRLNPDKQYIDKVKEETKYLDKFQILLSQGEFKYYLTLDHESNSALNPCYYFNMLVDKSISGFENLFFRSVNAEYSKTKVKEKDGKEKIKIENNPKDEISISPTKLTQYVICPKKYSYSTIILPENRSYFLKGTLLHNFAEFYFHYPEDAKTNFKEITGHLLDKYKVFLKDGNIDVERTDFTVGMKAVMNFLDFKNFKKQSGKPETDKENFLFDIFKRKKIYTNTEYGFENQNAGVKGNIDLISGATILDYKTSKQGKTDNILLREFNPELLKENDIKDVNFQTAAYIAGERDNFDNEVMEFIYLLILSDKNEVLKGNEKITASNIKYIPLTFKDYILSEECFLKNANKQKSLKDGNEFLFKIGYENYKMIIETKFEYIDFYDQQSVLNELEDLFYDFALNNIGLKFGDFKKSKENRFREDIVQKPLKYLTAVRNGSTGQATIFKDDIDKFVKLAKEKIQEINNYKKSDFPNQPANDLRMICKECDYLNICIGNKFWSGVDSEDFN